MQNKHHITLAVFPFEDLSPRKELGIFCRSFSDDLMTELSRFRQFQVIKFLRAAWDGDPATLPATLEEGYYVQGSFRGENDTVLVHVQLFDGDSQYLVWGDRIEGKLAGLSKIQDKLLRGVVAVLQQQIDLDLLSKIRRRPKVAFNAYEHCLYGMEELKKASVEADLKAREHFQKALEIQPDYALACTGMSLSYFNEWTCQLWDRWDVSKTGAYEWAQKAIELDEQNHIIAMVLGRIFLYEGSYSTAGYYFRRSLVLNPNDPDTLFPISLYFVSLGLSREALELYEKGLQLHPMYTGNHFRLGGVMYFELGEYEKAASFIEQHASGKPGIADQEAYCAAVYYYLKQYDKMQMYWDAFLNTYKRLISKGRDFEQQEAIGWILKLNPHRHKTNLEEFLQFISNGSFEKYPVQKSVPEKPGVNAYYFVKDSAIWKFSFEGYTTQIPEMKGYYDLQKMLAEPRRLFHCAELMGSILDDSGEKLIDEKAREQYQKKILNLQNEIEEAEQYSDFDRLEKLQEEYDLLIEHLSGSLNLRGKSRKTGGAVEKARAAVTWRIRNAIARIEQHHPTLGTHLSNAVKTGTLCSYKPEREIPWITS
ncbi:tetratricopeptide repeat protein [Gaoshiqia sp. Z1-71]|uniref:tetratricopeptide repeat protein n=1 Tax=Gaoshiqia hydrogeniformans TaxID=3290090 RepID=UPI003BF8CC0B